MNRKSLTSHVMTDLISWASTSGKKKLRPECPDALDALDVSDATCLTRTVRAMAPCTQTEFATAPYVRTQLARRLHSDATATVYAFRTRSVRAFAFWTHLSRQLRLDAAVKATAFGRNCHGICPPDEECQGICLLDAAVKATAFGRNCHGICLPDEKCQGICHLDAASVIRTKNIMANSDRTMPVTAPHVQMQLSIRLHSDAAVTALKIAAKP